MKKLLIILAFGAMIMCTSSCRFIYENVFSVEACEKWYLDEIYDAALDGDLLKVAERQEQLEEWYDNLSSTDQHKADVSAIEWLDEHPTAAAALYEYL